MSPRKDGWSPDESKTIAEVQEAVAACLAAGWSLSAIARELGVTHPTVISWRDGETMPNLSAGKRLLKLAKRLRKP